MRPGILLTGAAGFIGYHVASALLARGERVVGLDNLNSYYNVQLKRDRLAAIAAKADDRFTFVQCDIANATALETKLHDQTFDRIVHLAAQAGVRHSIDNPAVYASSNLVGHLSMLEVARRRGVKHLVYASSSSVYGGNSDLPFRVEDRTDQPISLYAATKKANELMSESYAHLYRTPMTGLRFFTVYGPWGRPDMALWLFTKAISEGTPIRLFNQGRMRRDFTYVDDVSAGVLACLDSPPIDDNRKKQGGSRAPHALYNVGNSRSETLSRLVELIERELGRKALIDLQPMQSGDVPDTFADITAMQRDHGFVPGVSLDEGVPRFVTWYRKYHEIS